MRILTLALSALLVAACGSNDVEIGNKTTVDLETLYEAGTVKKGEVVKADIKIKNTGEYPLVIGEVSPGCSCTIASKPSEPINPGKTGVIQATVDTDKIGIGTFSKDVRIVANTDPSTLVVTIRGEVID